jgi:hypothetical protein
MRRHNLSSLVMLGAAAAIAACSTGEIPVIPRIVPRSPTPLMARIKATDSLMVVTQTTFSDTASTLARLAPLAADTSVTAVIGPDGGELRIDALGAAIVFPKHALSANTTITMTALHGAAVAYDFQPHGLVFGAPVSIQQNLSTTIAGADPLVLDGAHGAYFDAMLDSSYVDAARTKVKVKETQLGYPDISKKNIKFSIGHFSGYIIAMGRKDEMQ